MAPSGKTLIRGGTVLSMDPALGDLPSGDVLIEGEKILAVGPDLSNGEVEMIDASGMIVMPGFVDSHRHIWEGLLRNIGTDVPLEGRTSYISFVLHKLAPAFRTPASPTDRKSTRLNSSHSELSRMPSSA